jgi:four helix bundle protein
MGEKIRYHTELSVYQMAFDAAREIFEVTKSFPKEEGYSLTDQIRRSSRSVCANLAEAWRKRRYQAAFTNSINHVEAEAAETQVWLSFSKECGYLSEEKTTRLTRTYDHILGICVKMINNPDQWVI